MERVPQEVILEGQGVLLEVVPPLYEEGPLQHRSRSALGSTPEFRPHAKNEDSYTVWTLFGLLGKGFFDLFGVCV